MDDAPVEHEMVVTVMPSHPVGGRSSTDVFVSCPCGWKSLAAENSQRGARRVFARHLRKVATGAEDRGDARTPDEPREVLRRHQPPVESDET